jgi:hypothetical protein
MPRDAILQNTSIAAKAVEQDTSVLQSLAAVVSLQQADHLGFIASELLMDSMEQTHEPTRPCP